MTLTTFHEGWTVAAAGRPPVAIMLPHDAMLGARRSPEAPSRYHGAWFHGERYMYRKDWTPGRELVGKRVALVFEGVQRRSVVSLDGHQLAVNGNGYREFEVELTDDLEPGRAHAIEVVADVRELPNGRWYSGAGIYRPVWLRVTERTRLARDGLMTTTRLLDGAAELRVEVEVDVHEADVGTNLTVEVALRDRDSRVATERSAVIEGRAALVISVADPQLWSDREPNLYSCRVVLRRDDTDLDQYDVKVGIRTIELDLDRGLLINGVPTLLRGGNIHHDNGIIGAVSTQAAESRRARILKEVGYNAIRSAHNPTSRALLDACDETGILLLDELTDVWWDPKTMHDDSATFETDWPADLRAMVRRDRRHPSVFAYSIGNENGETGTGSGVELARRMRAVVRASDDTRPVTAGVNLGLTSAAAAKARRNGDPEHDPTVRSKVTHPPLDSTKFNILFAAIRPVMELANKLPGTERGTRAILSALDVAGYNYGIARYTADLALHPTRFIYGSETMPGDIARVWPLVEANPRLLGDFMWSAWDYLGETGIGTWVHGRRFAPLMKSYPALTAGAGAIDIIGTPGAPALLARAAWGLTDNPGIAVRPLQFVGQPTAKGAWRSTDAVPSWSWRGCEGITADLEVYSAADTVELFLNARSVGRKEAGAAQGFVTRFRVRYEPGVLEAVAFRNGREVGRSRLVSAQGSLQLSLLPGDNVRDDDSDTEFVEVSVTDSQGTVEMLADAKVELTVTGPAELVAFGSAAPSTTESYLDAEHRTYFGRALAVVRFDVQRGPHAGRGGRVTGTADVHADAPGLRSATLTQGPKRL